jgi:hypothetical protein
MPPEATHVDTESDRARVALVSDHHACLPEEVSGGLLGIVQYCTACQGRPSLDLSVFCD